MVSNPSDFSPDYGGALTSTDKRPVSDFPAPTGLCDPGTLADL